MQETLNKIASRKWDVVVLQEQSQRPAFDEDRVCRNTVDPLNTLVKKIKESSPNANIQVYFGLVMSLAQMQTIYFWQR